MAALYDVARRDPDARAGRDARRSDRRPDALHGARVDYFNTVDARDLGKYWHTTAVMTGPKCWQPVVIYLSAARYVTENGKAVKLPSKRAAMEWLRAHK